MGEGTWDWLRNSSGLNLFTRRRYETSATPCFDLFLSLTLSRRYVVYVLGTHFRTGYLSGFTYGSLHQPKRTLSGELTSDPHIHCLHLFASLPVKCPSFSRPLASVCSSGGASGAASGTTVSTSTVSVATAGGDVGGGGGGGGSDSSIGAKPGGCGGREISWQLLDIGKVRDERSASGTQS